MPAQLLFGIVPSSNPAFSFDGERITVNDAEGDGVGLHFNVALVDGVSHRVQIEIETVDQGEIKVNLGGSQSSWLGVGSHDFNVAAGNADYVKIEIRPYTRATFLPPVIQPA